MAAHASAAQPERRHDVGADHEDRSSLFTATPNPLSMACPAVRR